MPHIRITIEPPMLGPILKTSGVSRMLRTRVFSERHELLAPESLRYVGPEEIPILWSLILSRVFVSFASNLLQNDIGNYSGPYSMVV